MKDELEKLKRVKAKKRKKSSINERACNTDAVRSFHHYGWGAYKLADTLGANFTPEKPCDIICESPKGRYVPVESKLIKKYGVFNSGAFQPSQIFELNRAKRSFVFLFVKIPPDKAKGTKRVNKLCVLDWKIHGKRILTTGISLEELKAEKFGMWLDPFKQQQSEKTIYDIRRILK
jgi:hypothetical protein